MADIQITKNTIIGDIIRSAPETFPLFMAYNMNWVLGPTAQVETLEQACLVHGIDCDEIIGRLNSLIAEGK